MQNQAQPPKVLLAPLAGITDLPFRNLVLSFGADRVVSEMVASAEAVNNRPSAQARTALGLNASQTAVQIAGKDVGPMVTAAQYCEDAGARTIDINMGCPAKKVTNGYAGAALMQKLDHARDIISGIVNAVSVPVTLKMRLGWDDDSLNAPELAKIAEGEGLQLLTVHGRTRCQFYKGQADWKAIKPVKQAVSIPVVANGDIVDLQSAKTALAQSGADAIMVGRGSQGRPWLLDQLRSGLLGANVAQSPTGNARLAIVQKHYDAMLDFYDQDMGVKLARKHLGWYMDRLPSVDKALRQAVLTEKSAVQVSSLLTELPWEDIKAAA